VSRIDSPGVEGDRRNRDHWVNVQLVAPIISKITGNDARNFMVSGIIKNLSDIGKLTQKRDAVYGKKLNKENLRLD